MQYSNNLSASRATKKISIFFSIKTNKKDISKIMYG